MENIINLLVHDDSTLPDNTIVVSEKVYEIINQKDCKLIRNPKISSNNISMVNIEKSDELEDNICKVSIDIAIRLGIDFSGDIMYIDKI